MEKLKLYAPWVAIILTMTLSWGDGMRERGKMKAASDAAKVERAGLKAANTAQWQQIGGQNDELKALRDRIGHLEGRLDRP